MGKIKNNWHKVLLISLLTLCFLFICSTLLIGYYEPIVKQEIKKGVLKSSNKLYRIEFDDIGINIFTGKLSVKNVQLIPNIGIYKHLQTKNLQPRYLYSIYLQRLKLSGINIYDLIYNQELQIDEILLNEPSILILNDKTNNSISDTSLSLRHPYEWIKEDLKSIKIDNINFKNVRLDFVTDSAKKRKSQKLFLAFFKIKDLVIDSNSRNNFKRPFYAEDIRFSIKNFERELRDSVNKIRIEEILVSTSSSSIDLYNFKVIPNKNIREFKDKSGFRKIRIDAYIKHTKLENIDFKKLFYEQKLWGTNLILNKLQASIEMNKLIPEKENKVKKFPTEILFDLKFPFHFSNLILKNSDIKYSEMDLKTKYLWSIGFNNINGNIKNFGNDSAVLLNNPQANININCLFNNKAKSTFLFNFNYLDPTSTFYVRGHITNYSLKELNPILSNLARLEIANCDLRSLKFSMNGNKKYLYGNITMLYNNLRIRVLQVDENDNKLKKHIWYSMIANTLLLNNDNPQINKRTIHSNIMINRKSNSSFFSFIWDGLFKGIKENVGLNEKMESELYYRINRVKQIKSFREQYKELRKDRREERKVKREERRKLKQARLNIVKDENN